MRKAAAALDDPEYQAMWSASSRSASEVMQRLMHEMMECRATQMQCKHAEG